MSQEIQTVAQEVAILPGELPQPMPEFDEFNSLPDQFMMENFGLTSEEGRAEISFGPWKGTWAQMLADPKCPFGDQVRQAHLEGGVEGTQRVVEGAKMMGAQTDIVVRPKEEIEYALAGALTPGAKKKVLQNLFRLMSLS